MVANSPLLRLGYTAALLFTVQGINAGGDDDPSADEGWLVRPLTKNQYAKCDRPDHGGVAKRCNKADFANTHCHNAQQTAKQNRNRCPEQQQPR